MIIKSQLLIISLFYLSFVWITTAAANPFKQFWQKTKGNYFLELNGGAAMLGDIGRNGTVHTNNLPYAGGQYPIHIYHTATTANHRGLFDFGVIFGLQTKMSPKFNLYEGVGVYQTVGAVSVTGSLYNNEESASGDSKSYSYDYAVGPRVMLELEGEYQLKQHIYPFIQLGIGYAPRVTLKNYRVAKGDLNEQGTSFSYTPGFPNTKQGKWVYQAAVGVNYRLREHWNLGVSYSILTLGKVAFDPDMSRQNTNASISTQNIIMQQLMLTIRYSF